MYNIRSNLKANTPFSCVLYIIYSNRYRRQQVRGTRVAIAAIRRLPACVVPIYAMPETVSGLTRSVPSSGQRRQIRNYLLRDNVFIFKPSIRK